MKKWAARAPVGVRWNQAAPKIAERPAPVDCVRKKKLPSSEMLERDANSADTSFEKQTEGPKLVYTNTKFDSLNATLRQPDALPSTATLLGPSRTPKPSARKTRESEDYDRARATQRTGQDRLEGFTRKGCGARHAAYEPQDGNGYQDSLKQLSVHDRFFTWSLLPDKLGSDRWLKAAFSLRSASFRSLRRPSS